MRLVTLHKVMIGAAIGACLLFALWAVWTWAGADPGTASGAQLAAAAAAVMVAAALAAYLRRFVARRLR